MLNKEKKRYKLYKSGKLWVAAPILFVGVTLGTTSTAKADQIQSHSITQSTTTHQSLTTTSNQKNAVTLSSKATISNSPINNSSNQTQKQESQSVANFATMPDKNEQNQQNAIASAPTTHLRQKTSIQNSVSQPQPLQQPKQNQTVQQSQTPQQGSLDKYTFAESHSDAKQVNQNNNWYLQENGKNLTGFQKINNQNKICYYNPSNGAMVYGQQKINDQWYLFDKVTGALQFGYQWINSQNKEVYYDPNKGNMVYGFQTINGKEQYFDPVTGAQAKNQYIWDKNTNASYYFNGAGDMVHGQQRIDGHWQYFNLQNGKQARNQFVNIKNQDKTVYYDNLGNMLYGQQKLNNKWYLFDNVTGAVEGVFNNADVVCQRPELPTGCEITAVTMMLKYAGCNVNKIDLANEMPRSNDGNKGFVGNPFSPSGWWIFPTGIAPVVNHHIGHSQIMTGASLDAIKNKLIQGHLVVIWVANIDGFINHALTLTGFRGNTLYYNDPWTGQKASMSTGYFYQHWNADAQRAISY